MRDSGFSTIRSKNISTNSALDKSRLIIPEGQDLRHTLTLMMDEERLRRKGKKKASIDPQAGANNAIIDMKLKSNFLTKERHFDKRKRSHAVKAAGLAIDGPLEAIPRGSPRAALIERALDNPEKSNQLSHVMSYHGKGASALPPLATASHALAQKHELRKINHTFNVDYNNMDASKYYELQRKSKAELGKEFHSIVKEPTKMPKLALRQLAEKQQSHRQVDEEFITAGRVNAYGNDLNLSKLMREPVLPKTTKNHLSVKNIFRQQRRTQRRDAFGSGGAADDALEGT